MPSEVRHHSRGSLNLFAYALLALACGWPYFGTLTFPGMTGDPALWIGKASALHPEWRTWVFASDHFTWYRPLAALTFHLNYGIAGLDPLPYRALDLALHLAAGFLLWKLARRLLPLAPGWIPFAAAALFLAHPCSEEVVPYIARRSYSLATLLGLAALLLATPTGAPTRLRALLSGLCLAAALLSNEAAVVFAPVALALLLRQSADPDAPGPSEPPGPGPRLALAALPIVAALTLRTAVLAGLGGYGEGIAQEGGPATTLGSAWRSLTALEWLAENPSPTLSAATAPLLVLSALAVLLAGVMPVRSPGTPDRAAPAGWSLLLWLAGMLALVLASGLWVERQTYFLLPPFALLLARLAATLSTSPWRGRPLSRLAWIPLLLLALNLAARSPVLRGPSESRLASWRERRDLLVRVEEDFARIDAPARVHVAFPNLRRRFRTRSHPNAPNGPAYLHQSLRHPMLWSQLVGLERGLQVTDWIYYDRSAGMPVLRDGATGRLEFPEGCEYWVRLAGSPAPTLDWSVWTPGFQQRRGGSDPTPTPSLEAIGPAGAERQYVYVAATDGGVLSELRRE